MGGGFAAVVVEGFWGGGVGGSRGECGVLLVVVAMVRVSTGLAGR